MNTRSSLREFQRELAQRLKGDSAAEAAQAARLGVQAAGQYFLIRLEEAGEVLAMGTITPVPLTRPWFCGLTNVRGNLFSVIDFSQFIGGTPTATSADPRLLLINDRFRVSAALLVERMLGLRTLQQLERDDSETGFAWSKASYRDAEGRVWREISMAELVHHDDFLHVGL